MRPRSRQSLPLWLIAPLCALAMMLGWDRMWLQRTDRLTAFAPWSVDTPAKDAGSPTGYAGGVRWLVPPLDDAEWMHAVMQAQEMLATGEWTVTRVDYENAPEGRPEAAASAHRWWLALVARLPGIGGAERPDGEAVERAARVADPLVQAALLAAMAALAWWRFGGAAAGWVALGVGLLFPFLTAFVPAAPGRLAWGLVAAMLEAFMLACGGRDALKRRRGGGRVAFAAAGVAGGVLAWIDVQAQVLVSVGVVAGALFAASASRRGGEAEGDARDDVAAGWRGLPWRMWSAVGAATALGLWAVDGADRGLGWRPDRLSVAHAVVWLLWAEAVGGAVLFAKAGWGRGMSRARVGWGAICALVVAVAVGWAVWGADGAGVFSGGPLAGRLTRVGQIEAPHLWAWIAEAGLSGPVMATLFPVFLLAVAAWLAGHRKLGTDERLLIALPAGISAALVIAACVQLRWWVWVDTALIATMPGVLAGLRRVLGMPWRRWVLAVLAIVVFSPGVLFVVTTGKRLRSEDWTGVEAARLVTRDFGYWLARRSGEARPVVLAPPAFATALSYFGGVRGVASFDAQNEAGLAGAIRIVSAKNKAETLALIESREVTHVVIPSWDPFLDELVRIGRGAAPGAEVPRDSFLAALHTWALPPWLRATPYSMPPMAGFEGLSILVFEVVEDQEEDEAAARLAEFFVETGRADEARRMWEKLARFPASLTARAATARVAFALRDKAGFETALADTVAMLDSAGHAWLPWDRRVSIALLLADGKRMDLARPQLERCLEQVDEARLRSLSTVALARFLTLIRVTGMEIADTNLREKAFGLLPPRVRERVRG